MLLNGKINVLKLIGAGIIGIVIATIIIFSIQSLSMWRNVRLHYMSILKQRVNIEHTSQITAGQDFSEFAGIAEDFRIAYSALYDARREYNSAMKQTQWETYVYTAWRCEQEIGALRKRRGLLNAFAVVESSLRPYLVGAGGETGMFQWMPYIHEEVMVRYTWRQHWYPRWLNPRLTCAADALDVERATKGTAIYLDWLLDYYNGDEIWAYATYRWGTTLMKFWNNGKGEMPKYFYYDMSWDTKGMRAFKVIDYARMIQYYQRCFARGVTQSGDAHIAEKMEATRREFNLYRQRCAEMRDTENMIARFERQNANSIEQLESALSNAHGVQYRMSEAAVKVQVLRNLYDELYTTTDEVQSETIRHKIAALYNEIMNYLESE